MPKQANNVGDSEADGQEVGIAAAKPVVREYAFAQAHVKGLCIREVNGATGIGKSYIFRYRLLVARNIRRIRLRVGCRKKRWQSMPRSIAHTSADWSGTWKIPPSVSLSAWPRRFAARSWIFLFPQAVGLSPPSDLAGSGEPIMADASGSACIGCK